ncbi:MAG: 2-succinyl-5-enolpyruvyl-6-hydroxy-3-cyclohexene-1-carboxylic-acid synthase [Sedimenticola sp.]|nr:2-succinyl-5-enolpyruvyl-6-hydroxy-3-cyclohexene-1-carboxylic-acid synthase [Sedimenticola sp.]
MPDLLPGEANLLWAYALIDGLAADGVTQAVISPGSRSTPLVLACDGHPAIELTVQVDERCAAFLALGLAKQSHKPVILIATSGSAPAHWYPAVIEASHSNIPLILVTADRPPELHGWGANQTTDQQRLFGSHLRAFHDPGPAQTNDAQRIQLHSLARKATMESQQPHPGPVQINIPFREPLLPNTPVQWPARPVETVSITPPETPDREAITQLSSELSGKPGFILCGATDLGADFAQAVTRLAKRVNCPILADPLSNLRHGSHDKACIIENYDAFIESQAEHLNPSWILRFGALPVSKGLLQYLDKCAAPQLVCDPYQQWPKLPPHARLSIAADPTLLCAAISALDLEPAPADWLATFTRINQTVASQMIPTCDDDQPFEGSLIHTLLDCLPNKSLLFSGNSMPIRQLDSWSGNSDKEIHIAANRGVSGIDGNLSTFIGMASGDYKAAVALLGDLAFYHDMNGLLAARDKDLVIVLINNNGGGIFGYLPQSALDSYEKYWNTATHLDFEHTATLYGLNYQRITRQSDFIPALELALNTKGPQLIEVLIDRDKSIAKHRHYRALAARQISG